MTRLTNSISLVLISSSLILAGCKGDDDPHRTSTAPERHGGTGSHTGYRRSGLPLFVPFVGGGRGSSTPTPTPKSGGSTSSSRGGFGSSSHSVGG
jgi:hypothetical protein